MIGRFAAGCFVLAGALILGGCQVSKRVGPADHPMPPMPAVSAAPMTVRVALAVDVADQVFSSTGPWMLAAGESGPASMELAADAAVLVRAREGRVVAEWIGHSKDLGRPLWSDPAAFFVLEPVDPGDYIRWDGRLWRGALRIEPSVSGGVRLTIINRVDLESYLAGVVPMEMGRGRQPAEMAALAAQAVAARTYAAAMLRNRRGQPFDLYADVRDQVYGGVAVEDSLCNRAIAMTAGLVLRRGPDQPLADAFYHSTCGGHTAAISAVWPALEDPLLCGVSDRRLDGRSWCADSRYSSWQQRWSWAELEQILARTLPAYLDYTNQPGRSAWSAEVFRPTRPGSTGRTPGALMGLDVAARTAEGRVAVLEITTEAGLYRVRGDQTRRVLQPPSGGPAILRSAWFELEAAKGREVQASGRGWGHGIGMCQMGALGRARAGQSYAAILAHYYPGSALAPLVSEVLP